MGRLLGTLTLELLRAEQREVRFIKDLFASEYEKTIMTRQLAFKESTSEIHDDWIFIVDARKTLMREGNDDHMDRAILWADERLREMRAALEQIAGLRGMEIRQNGAEMKRIAKDAIKAFAT